MAKHNTSFKELGVSILGISADSPEESSDLVSDLALPFDLLHDNELRAANAYGVAMDGREIAVPSIFILSAQGNIHFSHVGENMADRPNVLAILSMLREMTKK